MFRKALETLVGASILVPILAGCFEDHRNSGSTSVSMTLVDPSNPAPSAFRFTLTGMSLVTNDDTEVMLFPPDSDPLATTRMAHQTFSGSERYLGQWNVPPGNYRAIRFQYQDAEAGTLTDPRPVVPSFGDLEVALPDPLAIPRGSHRNVRLVFDLEHSLSRAGGAFLIDPLTFAQVPSSGSELTLSEFVGSVTDADAAGRTLHLVMVHTDDARSIPAQYGDLIATVPPAAVLIPADRHSFPAGQPTWLADFLGANPRGQWVEIFGTLEDDGLVRVHTASVRPNSPQSTNVQVEGIVTGMGSENEYQNIDVQVTNVESDGNGTLSSNPGRVRFIFAPDAPPPAFISWTGEPIDLQHLNPGAGVQLQGYEFPQSPNGAGFLDTSGSPTTSTEPHVYYVTHLEVRPATMTGTIAALTYGGASFCLVDLERVEGSTSDAYPHRIAVALGNGGRVVSDGIVPMPANQMAPGQQVELTGFFGPRPPVAPAPGASGSDDAAPAGDVSDHEPWHPDSGEARLPFFIATKISVRGTEFQGDIFSQFEPQNSQFQLTGDGSDFGYPDPTTVWVQVSPDARIVTESTAGRTVGVSTTQLFSQLPYAHNASIRGHVNTAVNPPVFTISWIDVELP